jgi:Tol biopolymer transport system component
VSTVDTTRTLTMTTAAAWLLTAIVSLAQGGHVMYHFPQWSPDGARILVSSTADGDSEIYILGLTGQPPIQLTRNSVNDDAARWIDGGRRILFLSDRRGRMESFVMAADGSDQRAYDGPPVGSMSPDGRTRLVDAVIDGRTAVVAETNGKRVVLTAGPSADQGSFSPDGRSIVYEQRPEGRPDDIRGSNIVVAKPDGSSARIVSSGTDPSWSPDGRTLLFKIWHPADQQLWIATVAPDGTAPARRLAQGAHPAWSPDGRRIAWMKDAAERTDIWVMNADGSAQRCITCA